MKRITFVIALSLLIGYGAANIQTATAEPKAAAFPAGDFFGSVSYQGPLTSECANCSIAATIARQYPTGNTVVYFGHRVNGNLTELQWQFTPAEFEEFRQFVAKGF